MADHDDPDQLLEPTVLKFEDESERVFWERVYLAALAKGVELGTAGDWADAAVYVRRVRHPGAADTAQPDAWLPDPPYPRSR